MKQITSFSGNFAFLSNFWPVSVTGPGDIIFPSVEHAYVAYKTLDRNLWLDIAAIETPGKVKRFGRKLEIRKDWDQIKVTVMNNLCDQKFSNPELKLMLAETSPYEIIEGNNWGDTFWGQCPLGEGKNILGKILMDIRDSPF